MITTSRRIRNSAGETKHIITVASDFPRDARSAPQNITLILLTLKKKLISELIPSRHDIYSVLTLSHINDLRNEIVGILLLLLCFKYTSSLKVTSWVIKFNIKTFIFIKI